MALPLEIICEIAAGMDLADINNIENALGVALPHYIYVPAYKRIFKKSIDIIKRIGYKEFITTNRGVNSLTYRYFGCSDLNNERHGECTNSTACNECLECSTFRIHSNILNITKNGGRYRRSVEEHELVEINPVDYPKTVTIKACFDIKYGKKSHSFRFE